MASIIYAVGTFNISYRSSTDNTLYESSKLLLHEMSSTGNITYQGHLSLVEELEHALEIIVDRM